MKTPIRIIFLIIFLMTFSKCAKRGFIDGGPKDTLAPVLRYSTPENFSTNFNAKQIKIYFDEYIKLKDVSKQLIVSPPQKYKPEVLPMNASKFITIKLKDTLLPNTTYSLNFGQSIQDNNEGNPFEQFRYVFSTGDYIDSLMLGGMVKDAFNKEVASNITVMLYEVNDTYNDSVVFKKMPNYVTNTLEYGNKFVLENLKEGKYKLVALEDKNNNYLFNPKSEKIGFNSEFITIPNDTLYELELFREITQFSPTRVYLEKENKLVLGFEGLYDKEPIKMKIKDDWVTPTTTKYPKKDSIEIWFPSFETDTIRVNVNEKDYKIIPRKVEKDSLIVNAEKTGLIDFGTKAIIEYNRPLKNIDKSKITLYDNDSLSVAYQLKNDEWLKQISIDWELQEKEKYRIEILPEAFEDLFGSKNDSLEFKYFTKAISNYGNLDLELVNVKSFPLIVQLADNKGETKYEAVVNEPKVSFKLINPLKYTVRFIYDTNKNGIWDPGNYLEKKQSEEVLYYPELIDVRQNWDVEQAIDLGG